MVCKPLVKPKHRKGLWSPDEDQRLRNYVVKNGHACWSSVPINAGLQRNGKSCRLRWINYLRPGLKRGTFSMQEEETILTLHRLLGNKWSQISNHLPGRTDNEIKNYFHTYLKKKLLNSKGSQETTKSNCKISPTKTPKKREIPGDDTSETTRMSTVDQKPTKSQSLPKLMFTDWLSLEGFACSGDVVVSGKGPTLEKHFNFNPSFQDYNFTDGNYDFIYHEASLVGEYQNSLSDGGSAGDDLFGSDFRFEGQSSGSDQFADFSSGDHICNVTMYNVMYI